MSRSVLVAIVAMVVFVVVAGAIYLELAASAGAKDTVWEVTQSVAAGDQLVGNVHRQTIPHAGDGLALYAGSIGTSSRASHDMAAGTILFSNDVIDQDLALINLTFRTPPQLGHGNTIDVYAQVGTLTTLVGRRLMVDQVNGSNCSVLVPAEDEPSWVTLQASNVPLFAARSTGVGVPQTRPQSMSDAIATLTGGSTTSVPIGGSSPLAPAPTPTPKKP
jgi:hypothetical protein